MRVLDALRAEASAFRRARRNRTDLVRWLWRRPAIMTAIGGYETGLLLSQRVDARLKVLASLKAASRTGCPF